MSLEREIRDRRGWILLRLAAVLAGSGAAAAVMYFLLKYKPWTIAAHTLQTALLLTFAVMGWKELKLLFRRPAKNMGTGWSRVWAVARAAILESWAGRIWLLPVLWLGAAFIMIGSVRTLGLADRMPEYIRMLLTSQELLLLVMMWVMACVSLPREREKKIVVTNASKPLSRLEIVLGKMTGFSVVAGVMVLIMGAVSLVILYVSNERLKTDAAAELQLQQTDTAHLSRGTLKAIAEEGSLFAYNYITVPPGGMSIVGEFEMQQDGPLRFIKGGSGEKVTYTFSPRLMADASVLTAAVGTRPVFVFNFPMDIKGDLTELPKIEVSASCASPDRPEPPRPQEKTLTLNANGLAVWEPDRPDELYSVIDPTTGELQDLGPVTIEVQCLTPGVMLAVYDGADADPATGQVPPNAQFNVWFSQDFNHALGGTPPDSHPVMRGFEMHDRQEIAGPKTNDVAAELGVFRFPGSSLRHVPIDRDGNFSLTLLLDQHDTDNAAVPTDVDVRIFSQDKGGGQTPYLISNLQVTEKRAMTLSIPADALGAKDPARRGDMYVVLDTSTRSHAVSVLEDSVRIELPRALFAVNLFKSEAVIFLEAVLLIVIGVTCSVRLGWAVAMFLSAVVFIFGYFVEFIVGIQEVGGLAALNYHPLGHSTAVFNFFDKASNGLWIFLGAIARMTPDFSGYQPQAFIPDLRNMPWSVVGTNALDTLVFAVPIIAIAFLLARKQELG